MTGKAKLVKDKFELLAIGKIKPSPTISQKARRDRLDDASLKELSESIAGIGVIEPIIVRAKGRFFELVAGERRWKASQKADLEAIPAIVRELSDDEVLDIQIHENLHREDVHPIDEAIGFKHLMDTKNYSIGEVAIKIGKSESYVLSRLKLNDLIPEVLADLASGDLFLTYAMEIAKYKTEHQKMIHADMLYQYGDKENGVIRWQDFLQKIDREIKLSLKTAPFSLKSKELRKDGLACMDCPERTGASPTLFGIDAVEENDKCLNRKCYESKITAHIKVQRKQVAKDNDIRGFTKVPILSTYTYENGYPDALLNSYYGDKGWKEIEKKKDICEFAEQAVWVDGNRVGQKQMICRDKTCKIHRSASGSSSGKSTPAELEEKRQRKEELLDMRVREPLRERVLKSATTLYDDKNWFFHNDNNLVEMVAKLFYYVHEDQNKRFAMICRIMDFDEKDIKKASFWLKEEDVLAFCKKCSTDELSKLLFLCMTVHEGEMFYNSYESQEKIELLAMESGFDYRVADAENRIEAVAKKYKPEFEEYLEKVKAGEVAEIPRIYSSNYKMKI